MLGLLVFLLCTQILGVIFNLARLMTGDYPRTRDVYPWEDGVGLIINLALGGWVIYLWP